MTFSSILSAIKNAASSRIRRGKSTEQASQPTPKVAPASRGLDFFREIFLKHGATYVPEGVNILGIVDEAKPGRYNDFTFAAVNGQLMDLGECTWEPGLHFAGKPMVPEGTAHLCRGWQPDVWMLGKHGVGILGWEHFALVNWGNVRPVRYYRDGNRNSLIDSDECQVVEGVIATNFHRGDNGTQKGFPDEIGAYSAGCPNVRYWNTHQMFMDAVRACPDFQLCGELYWRAGFLLLGVEDVDIARLRG